MRVTWLPAGVLPAVECPAADTVAAERALKPLVWNGLRAVRGRVQLPVVERLQDVVTLVAGNLSLLLPAIAGGRHRNLAGTAQPRMAGL